MAKPPPLIPVVVQDVRTNDVLMVAYTDRRALEKTRKTGFMHYWSRSRGRLWKKGEESGHVQKVRSLHYDCDRDIIEPTAQRQDDAPGHDAQHRAAQRDEDEQRQRAHGRERACECCSDRQSKDEQRARIVEQALALQDHQ